MISSSLHMFFLLNWPINSSLYNMWALVGYTFVTISGFCVFSFLKESSVMMFLFCKEHYDYYYYLRNTKICPVQKYILFSQNKTQFLICIHILVISHNIKNIDVFLNFNQLIKSFQFDIFNNCTIMSFNLERDTCC